VNVPKTRTVHAITQQRTVVTIDRDQNVYLNDKPINLNDLPTLLRAENANTAHETIYLRADAKVSWGAIATVMSAVKQAGITNISVVTQPVEMPPKGNKAR
jgi:biopolymer transport protein ExbD/biopolymer transport protein TolR